ncbi:LacI family DNA-binding transcriptional regulator [Mesorhizobium sp. M0244]|uniref:LacI family DNA-binding transcriptional regulator n=1 Tax=Mesorhizobium sp. M0244 TaxID=2956926 RepID=UPI00333CC911
MKDSGKFSTRRPTIADLARQAGVSISTVDRVLNGRDPVRRDKAERVLSAAEEIGFHAAGLIRKRIGPERPAKTLGFLLQQPWRLFYQDLGHALAEETRANPLIQGTPRVVFVDNLDPAAIAEQMNQLAKSVDALAVVTADHPHVSRAVDGFAERGVPVFALISELSAQNRLGYVGLDNFKVGRTAAWAISGLCNKPGKVGILVGSHRYRCQEQNEMGFRSYFREHASDFSLIEPLASLEDSRYSAEITRELFARNPDLVGLYVAGGGIRGVMQALREQPDFQRIITVGHDLTAETRTGLIDGVLKLVISHPIQNLSQTVVAAMALAATQSRQEASVPVVLPFDLHVSENV